MIFSVLFVRKQAALLFEVAHNNYELGRNEAAIRLSPPTAMAMLTFVGCNNFIDCMEKPFSKKQPSSV